jgi:hypothetical protein
MFLEEQLKKNSKGLVMQREALDQSVDNITAVGNNGKPGSN